MQRKKLQNYIDLISPFLREAFGGEPLLTHGQDRLPQSQTVPDTRNHLEQISTQTIILAPFQQCFSSQVQENASKLEISVSKGYFQRGLGNEMEKHLTWCEEKQRMGLLFYIEVCREIHREGNGVLSAKIGYFST